MKRNIMIMLRFLMEVLLFIILLPLIIIIELIWLIYCIRATRLLDCSIKEAFKAWYLYLKACLSMNKDFIINGI